MSAVEYNTWDGDPGNAVVPRRPSAEDMGGDELANEPGFEPSPEMPDAIGWNQKVIQVSALARVASSCKLSVAFNAGAPYILRLTAPGSLIVPATFTLTDNGAGDTSITWPANTFPPKVVEPSGLTLNENIEIDRARAYSVSNGVRVVTKLGATGTDCAFTVCLG